MAKNTVYPMLRRNTKNKLFANFTHLCNLALILLFFLTMLGCAPVASTVITTRAGDVDTDKDGISNAQEISLGLNPNNPDTDGDGLTDGSEIAIELNPLNPDTDSDGISDSDDSMPKLNNTKFFQYIGIGSVIILVTCIIFFQIKFSQQLFSCELDVSEKTAGLPNLFCCLIRSLWFIKSCTHSQG